MEAEAYRGSIWSVVACSVRDSQRTVPQDSCFPTHTQHVGPASPHYKPTVVPGVAAETGGGLGGGGAVSFMGPCIPLFLPCPSPF